MNQSSSYNLPQAWLKSLVFFLVFLSLVATQIVNGAEQKSREGIQIENPGSELWRNVRQRDFVFPGTSQVKGVDSSILINEQADRWARFRVNTLTNYGMLVLSAVALLILIFFLMRGRIKVEGGLSGDMLHRFSSYERVLHWVLALVFIFLAVTGLVLLFGRVLIIPLIGQEAFSLLASSSKESHNLFGPVFLASLLLMLFRFVKKNIYARGDLGWLLKGGGFIGRGHVTGGFFNMGEKSWYWLVIIVGLLISISGLILLLPVFGQGRVIMELSHVVHGTGAITLIAVAIGHIYLASVGTEGTTEGMKTGYVDIKWAEAHHDRWAKECHDQNRVITGEEYARRQGQSVLSDHTTGMSAEVRK